MKKSVLGLYNFFGLIDRKFRVPRVWSNLELSKFGNLFTGSVVNVSAWKDEDKEGGFYKNYFKNSSSYSITNYKAEACGFQGAENEIFLDLEQDLPSELKNKFDVVFNHTVLEHIYKFEKAFENLCYMSKDTVILVLPFLQEMHTDYGDYWRFTPLAIKKKFEEYGFSTVYSSSSNFRGASSYIFFFASKKPDKWIGSTNNFSFKFKKNLFQNKMVGSLAIKNSLLINAILFIKWLRNI